MDMQQIAHSLTKFALASICWVLAISTPRPALAGEFAVSPIRVDLSAAARSAAISVRNDGKDKLSFQLAGMQWTQDATGKDQYADTSDLIFFPKILTVEPGQEGLIRVGTKKPVAPMERTYRLFIEELPHPAAAPGSSGSAQINVLLRFGEPIFVSPVNPHDSLEIAAVALAKGALTFSAKNSGNRHQIVQGIELRGLDGDGKQVYGLILADRYLLAGTTKAYATSIAADPCAKMANLKIEFKTDKAVASRTLDVTGVMCP